MPTSAEPTAELKALNGYDAVREIAKVLQAVSEYLWHEDRVRLLATGAPGDPSPLYVRVAAAERMAVQLGRTMSAAQMILPEVSL